VVLAPGDEFLGGIWGGKLESILTSRGAYFRAGAAWQFVAYADIKDVSFPEKSDPAGALRVGGVSGSFELLAGRSDLWDVGRFFMRCAEDAKEV
jgi:hypothetical protein